MDLNTEKIRQAQESLLDLLGSELSQITNSIASTYGDEDNPYTIELPEKDAIDLHLDDAASLVARSANRYGRAARAAGIARGQAKLAKGRYDSKYKRSRVGKNEAEREEAAMTACVDEHSAWVLADTVAEVIEGIERGALVASESARKIYGAVEKQLVAAARQDAGGFRNRDFGS